MPSGRNILRFDLQRALRLYDEGGNLPGRAADLWSQIKDAELTMARAFWNRYRSSEEIRTPISDAQVEELAARIVPYLRDKFLRVDQPAWVETARGYVERALGANVSLSTLLAGLHSETEAAYAAIRAVITDPDAVIAACRTLSETESLEIDVFVNAQGKVCAHTGAQHTRRPCMHRAFRQIDFIHSRCSR